MSKKSEAPRGWHVIPYLPTPEGLTEAEARRLYDALLDKTGAEIVSPEDVSASRNREDEE